MSVKCNEIINFFEEIAPRHLSEDYDNVGLIIGSYNQDIKKILICLDVTSKVAEEAVQIGADLIISHHPLIFKGLKKINTEDPKGEIIHKLIKAEIGVYSAHTNLDFADEGLNYNLAKALQLSNIKNLKVHSSEKLYKVVTFVPESHIEAVRDSMSRAGAGWIGNYSDCSFMTEGTGTFRPLDGTNPFIGTTGNLEKVKELRLETVANASNLNNIINAMKQSHPYEEVAYDIYELKQPYKETGFGKTGELNEPHSFEEFISLVKNNLGLAAIRVIGKPKSDIKKVGVFCGSFDNSIIPSLKNVDILVTGDIKYHDALDISEMGLCVIDAGHFGTESIVERMLVSILSKKYPDVKIEESAAQSDPFTVV